MAPEVNRLVDQGNSRQTMHSYVLQFSFFGSCSVQSAGSSSTRASAVSLSMDICRRAGGKTGGKNTSYCRNLEKKTYRCGALCCVTDTVVKISACWWLPDSSSVWAFMFSPRGWERRILWNILLKGTAACCTTRWEEMEDERTGSTWRHHLPLGHNAEKKSAKLETHIMTQRR